MSAKKPQHIETVTYQGEQYQIDTDAIKSIRIQRAMANAQKDLAGAFDAMDAICCGKLDEYSKTIPEKDGQVAEYGTSIEAMGDFFNAAAEQVTGSKN